MVKLTSVAYFDGFTVSDEDVWQFIRKHSTIFDRLSSRKMVEMSNIAFTILQCTNPEDTWYKFKKGNWKFYKHPNPLDE